MPTASAERSEARFNPSAPRDDQIHVLKSIKVVLLPDDLFDPEEIDGMRL